MRRGASHDRWKISARQLGLSLLTLQRRNAVGDALRHKSALRRIPKTGRRASRTACDAERRTIIEKFRHDSWDYRSSRSSVGMPWVTLCVTNLRCAAYSRPDAERPERHATRSVARSLLRLEESLGCIQRPASNSWPRTTAARTCSGAVPPMWLRALTEPSSVSTANTSCSIWLLN